MWLNKIKDFTREEMEQRNRTLDVIGIDIFNIPGGNRTKK